MRKTARAAAVRPRLPLQLAGLLLVSASTLAGADEGPLEEVMVTSRKVEESLIDVPITVTAFTARDIAARGITDLNQIADFTPAFTISNEGAFRNDRSFQTSIIRGMTPSIGAPTASVFIDGSPDPSGFVSGIDDVERVEVLKGPQSTYFGRETFAGAINVVTKVPSKEWNVQVDGLYGNDDWHDVRATIEGPLFKDIVTGRFSYRSYSMQGQYANSIDYSQALGDPTTLGNQSTQSWSLSLSAEPNDRFNARFFGIYWEDRDGMPAEAVFRPQDYNCNAGAAPAGELNYLCGTLPAFPLGRLAQTVVLDPLAVSTLFEDSLHGFLPVFNDSGDVHAGLRRQAFHWNLSLNLNLPEIRATATSLSSINSNHHETLADVADADTLGIPNPYHAFIPNTEAFTEWLYVIQERDEDASQELRLTSDRDQRFRWLLGASFDHTLNESIAVGLSPFGPPGNAGLSPNYTTTWAGYFSLAFDILPSLTLTAEAREQSDQVRTASIPLATPDTVITTAVSTFHNFLPRVILEYKFLPEANVYASYSEGVNPGTFNNLGLYTPAQLAAIRAELPSAASVVQPEKLDNYEVGVKGRFLDNRLELTAATYFGLWKDQLNASNIQVPDLNGNATGTVDFDTNLGKTRIDGVEVEATGAITDDLRVSGAFAVAATKIDTHSYYCATCLTLTGSADVYGKQLPQYSKYTGSVSVEYTHPIEADRKGFLRADYIYRSGMWDSEANLVKTPDTNRVNFHLGVRANHFTVEAFVLNAFDNRAYTSIESGFDVLSPGFSASTVDVGEPLLRQEGLRVTYSYR